MRTRFARLSASLLALLFVVAMLPASTATAGPVGTWCGDKSNITVLGSSSSTGYKTTGYTGGGEYQPTQYGWWRRVSANAAQAWGTTATNRARAGALVADYLPGGRWPVTTGAVAQIAVDQPDMVLIQLGTNEYLTDVDPAAFEANLRQLLTDVRTSRPGVDVVLIKGWRVARSAPAYPWSQYGAVFGRVASSMGTALIDMQQLVDGSDLDTAHLYDADLTHLNDAGQSVLAAAAWLHLVSSTC